MKLETLSLAAALAAFAAGPSIAQIIAPEASLADAFKQACAEVAASPSKALLSCDGAKELESPVELQIMFGEVDGPRNAPDAFYRVTRTLSLRLDYAGCYRQDRDDLIPPYAERSYAHKGSPNEGYGLTIVTNGGASRSEILIYKGTELIGRSSLNNAELLSGLPAALTVSLDAKDDKSAIKAELRLR